jgi:co-chaperonin GroES (HSP10)
MLDLKVNNTSPAEDLRDTVGDISDFEIFNNQVLVAIFLRPKVTKGGIYMPDTVREEDKYQSKVGLVLALGPTAFQDANNQWFQGIEAVKAGDWIVFKPSDGWGMTINGQMCRMLDDVNVRGRVIRPDLVW